MTLQGQRLLQKLNHELHKPHELVVLVFILTILIPILFVLVRLVCG